jgi:hypothetical protein
MLASECTEAAQILGLEGWALGTQATLARYVEVDQEINTLV